jgi:hypothetical protein
MHVVPMATAIIIVVAINLSFLSPERDNCNLFAWYHLSGFVFTNLISLLPLEEPFKQSYFLLTTIIISFFPHNFTHLLFMRTR